MYIDVETRPDVIKHDMEGFSNYVADHFDHFENIDNIQLLTYVIGISSVVQHFY